MRRVVDCDDDGITDCDELGKEQVTVIPTKSLTSVSRVLVSLTILEDAIEIFTGTINTECAVKKTRGCVKGTSSLVMDRTSGTSSRSQNHRPSA